MMKSQRWLPVLSVAAVLIWAPQRGFPQTPDKPAVQTPDKPDVSEEELNKSHQVFPIPGGDPNKELLDRLHGKQLASFLEQFNVGQVDQKKLAELISDLKIDPENKRVPAELPKIVEELKQPGGISKERLKKLLEELRKIQERIGVADSSAASPAQPAANTETTPNPAGGQSGGGGGASDPETQDAGASSPLAERLISLAEKLGPALRKSPALQRVMRDLSMYSGAEDPRWQKMTEGLKGMGDKLGSWGQTLYLDRLQLPEGLSWPEGLLPGGFPHLRPPSGTSIVNSLGAGAGPDALPTAGPQGWEAALAILGLLGLAVFVAKILARTQERRAHGSESGWRLGPWPVDPAAIASRQELVQAFEYVSLLNLGPAARNWNHRAIAERLRHSALSSASGHGATAGFTGRQAVDELAALYEQARYAPPGDFLPDTALATARRDLCLLAGVPGA